ncbi:hypothetical protein HDU97_008665, partial [Phlyctochytrium planicorne]
MAMDMIEDAFEIKVIGEATFGLGVEIVQSEHGIHLHQRKYVEDLKKRFFPDDKMRVCSTPMETGLKLWRRKPQEA